ncbi:hypothetical protein ACH49M_29385 [Rhodococcus qingshengii]|jgi:hypothetical protein|uniref:Uncharacterized protein n=1 Tax=Rhodococcus baikonurensis TaxID=172041 RepID=A0ABV5XQ68_9NOCA|nr:MULTISPECIES: hypothetical protein [Rhodococcus]EEN85998.1 hypothetical protein RHOER0001_4653 [Rhodococcus erythropolis SK121]MBP1053834.1 hypothetical protein [Rhodococcus qingshengii]MBW0282305.1 hypothetical protein [Rhodococcus sp. FH8]
MFALSFELSTTKAIFVGIAVACLLILGVRLIFKDWVLRMENMFLWCLWGQYVLLLTAVLFGRWQTSLTVLGLAALGVVALHGFRFVGEAIWFDIKRRR